MATSREETKSVELTADQAAEILLELHRQWIEKDAEVLPSSTLLLQQPSNTAQKPFKLTKNLKKTSKKISRMSRPRIKLGLDDSDETLMIIQEWNNTESHPENKLFQAERYSEPIKKQLTVSDVKEDQSRLMLGKDQVKKKMFPLLEGSEDLKGTNGLDVSVYGPNDVVQGMKFKMWSEDTPVLTSGWKEFVAKCDLKEHCDFLTVWMFRQRDTRKICFAINKTRHPTVTRPLGKKISQAVFKDPS